MNTDAVDELAQRLEMFLAKDDERTALASSQEPLHREVPIRTATWRPWLEKGGHSDRGTKYKIPKKHTEIARVFLEDLESSELRPVQIDRRMLVDLSAVAAKGADADLIRLWVATMMWGSGTSNGRGPWRTAQGLADERLTSTLSATLALARSGNLVDAYRSWHLPGCGEAFFTKWFWTSALTSKATPTPLILDLRVRNSIAAATDGHTIKLRGAAGYAAYCEGIQQVATRLAGEPHLGHIDAEKVEWLLFDRGIGSFYAWLGQGHA